MNRDPIIIIGGGLAGLTAGRTLQEAGREYEEMLDIPFEHLTYDKPPR